MRLVRPEINHSSCPFTTKGGRGFRGHGFSLVELVIFIAIIGILAAGLFSAFTAALRGSADPFNITRASQLAQERMELILAQRRTVGFAGFVDPCPTSPLPVCTVPWGYNIPPPMITPNWLGDNKYKVITVTVTGPSTATLTALVAEY